jgi:hypothetical protein
MASRSVINAVYPKAVISASCGGGFQEQGSFYSGAVGITKFFQRPDPALEGQRKLAGGKHCAATGSQSAGIAPRQGRWKVTNLSVCSITRRIPAG